MNDNTQDAGMCKKCENGKVVNDNDRKPALCRKCENGKVVNSNAPVPGTCKTCTNGIVKEACKPNEQCCNGTCVPKTYSYTITTTVTTCQGSNTNVRTVLCNSAGCVIPGTTTTGKIEQSLGVCIGGSTTTVIISSPVLQPCP
jgi:hypothetical protein